MLTFHHPSFEETSSKEWLVTNGIGGYASGSLSGANTRRYHGLLVASMNPPTQRQVLVLNLEETLSVGDKANLAFSTNQFPGMIYPKGFEYLTGFNRNPIPCMVFDLDGSRVAKSIFMVHGSNTTVIQYENIGESDFRLSLTPFFVDRDYHSLFREDSLFDFYFEQEGDLLKIYSHYGTLPLYLRYFTGSFSETRFWIKNFQYNKEQQRGLDYEEDAYSLGKFTYLLRPGEKAHLVFSLDSKILEKDPGVLQSDEIKRLKKLGNTTTKDQFLKDLQIAADQFIVTRASTQGYSIIAGYHWFTDWGRDTMIAMRGLTIARGEHAISKSILKTFFDSINEGMLPNRFPDYVGKKVEYNTIDATLWLFVALYEYYQKFTDKSFISQNFSKLTEIIKWHLNGTRYQIQITEEGFLCGGSGTDQLTWMDARIGDYVVTPRHGCPVEIQALWYNALKIYQFLGSEIDIAGKENLFTQCNSICRKLLKNFPLYFLNDAGYLNDVITPDSFTDSTLRPNQIYVLSLPYSLLQKKQEERVFKAVEEHLFTPYGLRTLSPDHSDFKPVYEGDQWKRDNAYHQGTVWPFLLGDYFIAMSKVQKNAGELQKEITRSVDVLKEHFYNEGCIHGISEIFDGLNPFDGRGTVQQAWCVGALLSLYAQIEKLAITG
ncbi:MAG: glycogen debranching enzyme family protein [Saprospiraceae bacterium]|nr:glycogen debranching enzyme family protein [Saprospiraceae bacterium]